MHFILVAFLLSTQTGQPTSTERLGAPFDTPRGMHQGANGSANPEGGRRSREGLCLRAAGPITRKLDLTHLEPATEQRKERPRRHFTSLRPCGALDWIDTPLSHLYLCDPALWPPQTARKLSLGQSRLTPHLKENGQQDTMPTAPECLQPGCSCPMEHRQIDYWLAYPIIE